MTVKNTLNEIVKFIKKGNYARKSRKNFNYRIRTTFLEDYSATEENLDIFQHIKYGKVLSFNRWLIIGFKVKEKDVSVMDILFKVESMENIPNQVKKSFPNLTYAQLEAVLRITTIFLGELEASRNHNLPISYRTLNNRMLDKTVYFLNKNDYSTKLLDKFSQEIMQLFLEDCSETEENLHCFKHIEYGKVFDATKMKFPKIGFKIKGQDILVSEILHIMENMKEIPDEVKEYYPQLTYSEFYATLRLITILIGLYEDEITI